MKKRDKQLKRLAEKYYHGGYKLNSTERELLENSKYKKLLGVEREYSEFNKILENFAGNVAVDTSNMISEPVQKRTKYYMFQTKLGEIKDLLDEIEDAFFLGLENMGLDRFKNIDVNQLRTFIGNYVSKNIKDGTLISEIKKAMDRKTPWSIIYNLRMLLIR